MDEKYTIMIVDDEEEVRETLEALLAGRDYSFVLAASGTEAITLTAKVIPDLILLDIMLPGMDGFATCRKLRENANLASTPIVMITALDDSHSKIQAIDAGAAEFIAKPFDSLELELMVSTMLELSTLKKNTAFWSGFKLNVDRAPYGLIICEPGGIIRYVNELGCSMLARSATGDPVGRKIGGFIDARGEEIAELCKKASKLSDGFASATLLPKQVEGFAKGIAARLAPALYGPHKAVQITFFDE